MPESLPSGTLVTCRVIGVIQAKPFSQGGTGVRNDRYLAGSEGAAEFQDLREPGGLPGGMLEQLEKFLVNYDELERRRFKLVGVKGAKAAIKSIKHAIQARKA